MLNMITIQGRLTRDPELKTVKDGISVASFTLAVDRDRGETADFIDCTAWRSTADFVGKYFQKGSQMIVSGALQSEKYTDKDGKNRTSWKVVADRVYFCGSKTATANASAKAGTNFEPIEDNGEDLPF